MSIFDAERKRLGLSTKSQSSSASSFLAEERRRLMSGEKLQYSEAIDQKVDADRFGGRYDPKNTSKKEQELLKPKKNTTEKKQADTKPTKSKSKGLLDDLGAAGKATLEFFNPFDDVSGKEAVENYLNRDRSQAFEETARGSSNVVNSVALNMFSNLDKKINNRIPEYTSIRPMGEGGGIDMLTRGAGYLVPGVGAYKLLNAAKLGKGLTTFGQKGITQRLGSEAAKGAITGAGLAGAEVAIREGLNPEDTDWKDNLGHVAFGTATGAVADPALYGLTKGIGKGFETAANRTMKNVLPDSDQVARSISDNIRLAQSENIPVKDFPNMSNMPKSGTLRDLLPSSSDITNPSRVSQLSQFNNPRMKVETPSLGIKPIDETMTLPEARVEQPKVEEPTTFKSPESVPKEPNERGFITTLKNSEKSSEGFLERLRSTYEPLSNEKVVEMANKRVADDIEQAVTYIKTANKITPEHITTAHRLIDEFQKKGEYERAVDIAETIAEAGTKAGQSVQAFSIYNRLTPEGALVRAQRRVNQINENIGKNGNKVVITNDVAAKITETADSIQRLTGQEDISKDVMSLMEKVKKGTALTDDELNTVRSFVVDAKKFIGDLEPKTPAKPKKVKDTRTRDKVVDFMSKQEEVARKRLRERMNRANSLPVDVFYDLSVIGASKIAKGTVKMADFTEQMVKEFGEEIRPYMQQIYNKAVETFNLQSETITRQRLSEAEKITNKALKDKTLTEDEAEVIRQMAKQVGRMTGDAKMEASQELQATLQLLERPTLGQKVSTAQTIAQLLNPKTMVRNAIGNELFYRVERLSKYVASPIDWAQSKFLGGHRSVTFRTYNQGQYWRNFMVGAKAGWKGVNPAGLTTAYDLGPQAFRSKINPLTYLEKALGASLRAFDHAGYMRAYNKTLGELSTLRAMNEGLKGRELREAVKTYIREADVNIMNIADAYGKYATFQDNTLVSTGLQKLKRGLNFNKEFGFGDLVLKYPKTPGNLLMRALEYSPIGFLRSFYIMAEPLKKNVSYNSPEFAMSFARATVGTFGFSGLGYFLADIGILTGSGHSDYEVKALEQNSGKQPNSINITALKRLFSSGFDTEEAEAREGDTFVSFDWAQPIAIAIALGTGVSKSIKEEGELDASKAAYTGATGATNTLVESSVLSGVKKAFEFYPGQTFTDKVVDIAGELPSSFVPTAFNQVRQFSDNTARNTYDPELMKSFMNRATNRVPSLEKVLPPAYDTLGNQREVYQSGGNNAFNVFLNPSFVKKYKPSPEAKFVLDFINETGEKSVAPRSASKTISIDGESVKLTAKEYSELQRALGTETRIGLEKALPKLQGETDFEKIRRELEKVLNKAGENAREEIRNMR